MDDLAAFLGACLDEDERVARGATPGPWEVGGGHNGNAKMGVPRRRAVRHMTSPKSWTTVVSGMPLEDDEDDDYDAEHYLTAADADHIARWDPARVLAEVAAKREILRLHERDGDYGDGTEAVCHRCNAGGYDMAGDLRPEKYPCRTIFALAASYRSAPGWRPEWATEVTA